MRLNKRIAVAPAATCQPDQRAFAFIEHHLGFSVLGRNLAFGQCKMLRAKAIDNWPFVIGCLLNFRLSAGHWRQPRISPHPPSAVSSASKSASVEGLSRKSSMTRQA